VEIIDVTPTVLEVRSMLDEGDMATATAEIPWRIPIHFRGPPHGAVGIEPHGHGKSIDEAPAHLSSQPRAPVGNGQPDT
jgi:hypothetical protein